MSPDDNTHHTQELDGEYDLEHYSDVDLHFEDDGVAPHSIDLPCDVNMDTNFVTDYEEEKEEEEEQEEDVDKEKDVNEDDGKEPQTIGQGEMVNSSADAVDTSIDYQPGMIHKQGEEMCVHTPWPDPLLPAP
jgi:hypothetical protein